jgi:hypothetical protein
MDLNSKEQFQMQDSVYSDAPAALLNIAHLPTTIPLDPSTIWHSAFHWNGVAVYYEGGTRGAYAASIHMHAPPSIVFGHFVRLNDGSCSWDFFSDVEVLEPYPENDKKLVCPAQ